MKNTDDRKPTVAAAAQAGADAAASDWRGPLDELARALRRWHKALLGAQAEDYGALGGPFELLHLATTHPDFAWLRPLSRLMAELDELREQPAMGAEQVAAIRGTLERLMGTDAAGAFKRRMLELVQRTPEIAAAHADVRRLLARLPQERNHKEQS